MKIVEVLEQSSKSPVYAIKIIMTGDLGAHGKGHVTLYYRRTAIFLNNAKHTQDFTALKGAKPTLFKNINVCKQRAKDIQMICNRIHDDLISTMEIHREFFVRPVIWKED